LFILIIIVIERGIFCIYGKYVGECVLPVQSVYIFLDIQGILCISGSQIDIFTQPGNDDISLFSK